MSAFASAASLAAELHAAVLAVQRAMALQSVAAAGLQLLLAAHAEGLGGVWVCSPLFAQETIRRTLDLPASWEPQGMFFLGVPDGNPKARDRKDIREVSLFL